MKKATNKLQIIIKHIKTMFYNLVGNKFKEMVTMNKLRILMTIIIFLCIVCYHVSHLLVTSALNYFSVSEFFYEDCFFAVHS